MKKFTAIVLLIFVPTVTYAQDEKPKSMNLAWALALDPIPGDALFYAGRPVQGTLCALSGSVTGFLTVVFAVKASEGGDCNPSDPACGLGNAISKGFLAGAVIFGSVYASTLFWDGYVGIHTVKDHNRKIGEKKKEALRVQPTFGMNSGQPIIGARFRF